MRLAFIAMLCASLRVPTKFILRQFALGVSRNLRFQLYLDAKTTYLPRVADASTFLKRKGLLCFARDSYFAEPYFAGFSGIIGASIIPFTVYWIGTTR